MNYSKIDKSMNIRDYTKIACLFEGITGNFLPADTVKTIRSFIATENRYLSASREIVTKM